MSRGDGWANPYTVLARAWGALRPAPRVRLSTWIEAHLRLPHGVTAVPGPMRLWPYQREIADVMGDPDVERVTIVKPVRVGYTTLLSAVIASYVANDPAPILVLMPTESDARDYVVSELEPLALASPVLRGLLRDDTLEAERNTLTGRRFPGGSLKVVAAKAPRNLRRHTARVLLIDEADAMDTSPEGSPILLAERRTLSFARRKIIMGSTPTVEDTSPVLRAYAQSDQRVYEWPCAQCGTYTEPQWAHIVWPEGRPEDAGWRCPACSMVHAATWQPTLIGRGRWRATRPEVTGHAGFRLSALCSLAPHAAWGILAAEFVRVSREASELQVFVNTLLAQGWRDADTVDADALAACRRPVDRTRVPGDVLFATVGVDVQADRLEVTLVGHAVHAWYVLEHVVLWGATDDPGVWAALDEYCARPLRHPSGAVLRLEAVCIDAGYRTEQVYAYCRPRQRRGVYATKGVAGQRPLIAPSGTPPKRLGGVRLMIAGVDAIKQDIMERFARHSGAYIAEHLGPDWVAQITAERRRVKYHRGTAIRWWERIPGRDAEALDALVYALAARAMVAPRVDWARRAAQLAAAAGPSPTAPPVTPPPDPRAAALAGAPSAPRRRVIRSQRVLRRYIG